MRNGFYLPRNTKCTSHFANIWNFDARATLQQVYFYENEEQSPMDNDFIRHLNFPFTSFSNLHILFGSFSTDLKSRLP